MSDRPTKVQSELLDFIDSFIHEHGYGPSYREIMRSLNYKSVSTVAVHIDNLIKIGRLIKTDRSARSLVVVGEGDKPTATPADTNVVHWLNRQLSSRLDSYLSNPTPPKRHQLDTLIEALNILGLEQEAEAAKSRLSGQKLA
jgi:repressor LexA